MQTTELLAFDAAPDFVGPPPLRLVEKPAPRSPERQALADAVNAWHVALAGVKQLEEQAANAALSRTAAEAMHDLAVLNHAEAKRAAVEDVKAMLAAPVPSGMKIAGYDARIGRAGILQGGISTVGTLEAREAVTEAADMREATIAAEADIAAQLARAKSAALKLQKAVHAARLDTVRHDAVVARVLQVHADAGSVIAMLDGMHCLPAGRPGPRPEITAAWTGVLNELSRTPDLALPDLPD